MEKVSLDKLVNVVGGQIMSRVTANPDAGDEVVEKRKVLIPKSINLDGSIDINVMPEEALKVCADPKKVSKVGDIIMKLSPPYDAGLVTETSQGCIVPSFCAIIKPSSDVDIQYLLAFMNSALCKNQLQSQVSGAVMTVLSVGKVKNVSLPIPSIEEQRRIGQRFMESQRRLSIIRQIALLESKRNDILFRELEKSV